MVDKVTELAERKGVTPSQLAIAWVLSRGKDIVTIPGTKHVKYLEENLGAVDVPLAREELAAIDAVAPRGVAARERYHEAGMAAVHV